MPVDSLMKKSLAILITLCGLSIAPIGYCANLVEAYQQALCSDPIYQQAISARLAIEQDVPITRSAFLPSAIITAVPSITKEKNTGRITRLFSPAADTIHAYVLNLTMTQTVFNYAQFKAYTGAKATALQADASMNAAMQDLMLRVARAYFKVLLDEDNLAYSGANKAAFAKQLDQINQEYKVGLKTITDVYTAQASYDSSVAAYIAAETFLRNDKEDLRAITGCWYPSISKLSERFPLIKPHPMDREGWVATARRQNWSIRAAIFGVDAARENIKQQFAGHLPTLNAQGIYNINYSHSVARSLSSPQGASKNRDATFQLNFALPIYQGGLVVAETRQARFNYQNAIQHLEQTVRATVTTARQNYMSIIAGIEQIQADRQTIKSSISSLNGLREGYQVGTQTLVDVLNQQQNVFRAQQQYAIDRYAYVINLLSLKNATGTLSQEDLIAINAWLYTDPIEEVDPFVKPCKPHCYIRTRKKVIITKS